MSRNLLAVLLSELTTVRLICTNPTCGAVVEMPVAALTNTQGGCRVCGHGTNMPTGQLGSLFRAMAAIQAQPGAVAVEFVLPAEAP